MKKSLTRIFAVVLAVVMVALMIPVAGAYTDKGENKTVSFTLKCTKVGFEFTVYQLASLDSTDTGVYTVATGVPDAVADEINKANASTTKAKAIISACDEANYSANKVGEVFAPTDTVTEKTYTVDGGIYYVKVTKAPNTKTKAQSSLISLPYYNSGAWVTTTEAINLDGVKVNDSNVTLTKDIVAGDKKYAANSAKPGDVVNYEIQSAVPGSAEEYLTKYEFTDTLETGLTYVDNSAKVYLNGTEINSANYTITATANEVKVAMKSDYLKTADFYGENNMVKLTLSATVNNNATTGNDSNDNTIALKIENKAGTDISPSDETVQTFVFAINILKVDGKSNAALNGGKFQLLADDKTTVLATGTATDGVVNFVDTAGNAVNKVAGGKYYVQETEAPSGYVLDDTMYELDLTPTYNSDLETANLTVTKGNIKVTKLGSKEADSIKLTLNNYVITPPQTGGMGTGMFTLVGAILILAAGVMFILLKRKSSAK